LEIKKEFFTQMKALREAIAQMKCEITSQGEFLAETDQHNNVLEAKVDILQKENSKIKELEARAEDIKNRSRRNNIRVSSILEGLEGLDMVTFIQSLISEALKLPEDSEASIEIDRAYRALCPKPASTDRHRQVIIRLLRWQDWEWTLKATRTQGQIVWQNHKIYFDQDFSRVLQQKRITFFSLRQKLAVAKVKSLLNYPAILRVNCNGQNL
uniref:L1 transposable element RRM domain-containing protein n=1 Tax=Latimeria chalumnae TaxID=7897 RepID=H3ADR5_LATCH